MKKLLTAAVAALMLAGSVFAIEFSVDADVAIPLAFTSSTTTSELTGVYKITTKKRSTEMGFGGDVDAKLMLTSMFGLKADIGLYFPQSSTSSGTITTTYGSGGTTNTTNIDSAKTTYSDLYDSFTSFNIFVGPAIRFKKAKAYEFCVTPGFSVDARTATQESDDSTTKTSYTTLGAGAEFDARFNINKKFYLTAACPVIYQFKTIDSNDNEYDAHGLYVVPKVGFGYRF